MNPEHNHKTIAYIILGIIVVIALGIYIYVVLSGNQQTVSQAVEQQQPSASGLVMLTPEESQQKAAIIQSVMNQTAVPLSTAQASAKAVLIKKAQEGK